MALPRSVGLVLAFLGLAVLVSVGGILAVYFAVSRGPSVPARATLLLRPGGAIQEVVPDDVFGQIVGRDAATVGTFVDGLRMAKRDPRVTSVLLMPSTLELPFWGKLQELRDAVLDFRESGKTVVAFLEYGGEREYFLASAADQVFLVPTSPLDLTGLASYEVFLRGSLDNVGVYPDFVYVGDYKSAVNTFTENSFTPTHREMAESLNRDWYAQLVGAIATARGKSEDQVRQLFDDGPLLAEDALGAGLVDGLAYQDELGELVPELGLDASDRIEGAAYRRISPGSVGFRPQSRIAVLYAVGTITSGRSRYDAVNGAILGSDTIVEHIRRVREDDSIEAIVVRIDSPGGSSVASDVIWRELTLARDEAPSRPLIVSMSDLAASGGYYIATAGQVIVAQPATLTGSIGVYTGKMVLSEAMDKLGISVETVASGTNAAMDSPFEQFSPDQRERVQEYVQDFYDTFVEKVAESRGATPAEIHAVAQGRVWTGRQALERGLVDELGGLDHAIAIARERAGIPEDEDVELVTYPQRRSFYETLVEQFGADSASGSMGIWSLLATDSDRRALASLTAPVRLFRRGEPLSLMPFTFVR